ncbi:MAG: hypothetical protein WCT05_16850, partial [Lentisphaeria bacterium]
MREGSYSLIVTTLNALLMPSPPPGKLSAEGVKFRIGDCCSPEELTSYLIEHGYQSFDLVEGSGTFARRGGILDVFSPNYQEPLRIEFFGDEIDRIVFFDVLTQRTLETLEEAEIVNCYSRMGEERQLLPLLKTLATENAHPGIRRDIELLENGGQVPVDRYLPLLYPNLITPLDYHDGFIFIEEYALQQKTFSFMEWQLREEFERLSEKGEFVPNGAYFMSKDAFEHRWNGKTLLFSAVSPGNPEVPLGALRQIKVLEDHIPFYQEDALLNELKRAVEEHYTVYLMARPEQSTPLRAALTAHHIPLSDTPEDGAVCCLESSLSLNLRFP